MTIPRTERLDSMGRALEYMLEQIGDDDTAMFFVGSKDGPLADLPDTTWAELSEASLVERRKVFGSVPQYHLTQQGWVVALKLTDEINSDKVRTRGQQLAAVLKGYVKGRGQHHGALVDVRTLSVETGIPVGWLMNAIKSGLLQELFPGDKMNAYWDASRCVRVPQTFGMDLF